MHFSRGQVVPTHYVEPSKIDPIGTVRGKENARRRALRLAEGSFAQLLDDLPEPGWQAGSREWRYCDRFRN
jgi:hypothetical protein